MSNKIISLSRKTKNPEQIEVYSDINMDSSNRYWILKDTNIKAIFNSLRNIFTWIPGERILDPEFGSKLRLYLYEGITDYNKEKIVSEIEHCCMKWEPRVKIQRIIDVSTIEDHEDNTVKLDIIFTVPSLSEEQYRYSYSYTRPV